MTNCVTSEKNQRPKLAVIGGRLEDDNAAVYQQMHLCSGGRIVVFPTASSEPEAVGEETLAVFRAHGFDAVLAPVFGEQAAQAAHSPETVALIRDYGSVFFTGGNQVFITEALAPNGEESPVLASIREVYAAGGLVAGSSAGAAMMSDTMIVGGTSLEAVTYGIIPHEDQPGMLLGKGLGFFSHGIIDQHFIKRGRFGRLVIAMMNSGVTTGFGVDENTALFIQGNEASVVGEYGVFVIDMQHASYDIAAGTAENISFSYLDNGDRLLLDTLQALPHPSKIAVSHADVAYRAPARSLRNVFGAYTLYDLLARLVLGDPTSYQSDSASAIDPNRGEATSVGFERLDGSSQSLISIKNNELRMTAIGYRASLNHFRLNASQLTASHYRALARDYGIEPQVDSRMILLGSTPLAYDSPLLDEVLNACSGPVGIIAAASSEPRSEAARYVRRLEEHGIASVDLRVTIDNIERIGLDPELVAQIASLKTILLTGGNQIRLAEALLHRGEVTPILQAIVQAYAAGATIIAVSGAAAALSGFMIAGGSSYEAMRFGIASDMGRRGLVIQEGLGLFGVGVVDQNLISAGRLGRLVVACAEEGVHYGLGICDDSGFITSHDNSLLTVIGAKGVVLVETNRSQITLQADEFIASGNQLTFALPGDVINLNTGTVLRQQPVEKADETLSQLTADLIQDCGDDGRSSYAKRGPIQLRYQSTGSGQGILDIESLRDKHG
ncbi:cyanophycinase [Tatumella citrea]|nr:cyanophycinase [Tatumella citrea]